MTALLDYIEAWASNDVDRIAMAVDSDCVITECYGPIYRGRDRVRQWATTWFRAGGTVHNWAVTDHFVASGREAAQWTFECTWDGQRTTFDGATISRSVGGVIVELREYQTSAPLYEWDEAWQ
ncbi:nuclear transport factor 2 family protein [Gryllotalpicola reticulitermitis]|uniref:Nuclear transport factor 2 family protein n=1 Tax=Gryllotalpicola reticulitermitis TaxID=1184153 RepID=A0ABV8Q8V2_9MICO